MANFVRSESVVRDAVNFCADSDVIEVSTDRVIIFKTSFGIELITLLTLNVIRCLAATTPGGAETTARAARRTSSSWKTSTPR